MAGQLITELCPHRLNIISYSHLDTLKSNTAMITCFFYLVTWKHLYPNLKKIKSRKFEKRREIVKISFFFLFFYRSSSALHHRSSTEIMPHNWGTFCAGVCPMCVFPFAGDGTRTLTTAESTLCTGALTTSATCVSAF